MNPLPYSPVFDLSRGETLESIHFGAIAVVDIYGKLLAWYGDPQVVTFLRSSAKPFQILPFLEHGGRAIYNLTPREIAVMCASHSGTDEHMAVLRSIQAKTGIAEAELLCGVHKPLHKPTADALDQKNEAPTPNRHNCSGKHTGMLAFARLQAGSMVQDSEGLPYIDFAHPIQTEILHTFAEMCALPVEKVALGIDGCSAPNFAVRLRDAAYAYARLCDPETGGVTPQARQAACHEVTAAMTSNPDMVGGPERFDTSLMQVTQGRIVVKGGAEAYQGIGLMPGTLGPGSPAIGIALKIADGDARKKALPAVALEVLRQLGALSPGELEQLAEFGPRLPVYNWRKIIVGEAFPAFTLNRTNS